MFPSVFCHPSGRNRGEQLSIVPVRRADGTNVATTSAEANFTPRFSGYFRLFSGFRKPDIPKHPPPGSEGRRLNGVPR